MRTLKDLTDALEARRASEGIDKTSLASQVGISRITASRILASQSNFSVTTLLGLADRLGLEVLLVPKDAAGVFGRTGPATASNVLVQSSVAGAKDL